MVIAREPRTSINMVQGLRRDYTPALPEIVVAYLLGALHDGTERQTTWRIAQKSRNYLTVLQKLVKSLGGSAWIYKEGKKRNVWILEFSKSTLKPVSLKTNEEQISFIRGFWDADGGVAKSQKVKFYIYFAQKNKPILIKLKKWLKKQNIKTGKIHNPSKKVDSGYWRFYISTQSHRDFVEIIGSWHPEKAYYLQKVKR